MAFHVAYTEKSWFESSLVPARLVAGVAAQLPPSIGMAWQSVVLCGIPLVGSRGEGATVWPWDKQQIWIGVGLGHVPSKCREEKWRLTQCCVVFFARFLGGFLGFLGSGLVVELVGCGKCITLILVIGLIVHALYDLLPRDG